MLPYDVARDEQLKLQLEFERTQLALVRSPLALIFGPLLGLITAILLWPMSSTPSMLALWTGALIVVYGVRTFIRYRLLKISRALNPAQLRRNVITLWLVSLVTGVIWGVLPWLPVKDTSVVANAITAFVITGVTASAMTTIAAHRVAATLFIVPCIMPLTLKLISSGSSQGIGMGLMTLMFLAILLAAVRQISAYFSDNTALRLRTEADKKVIEERDKELRDNEAVLQAIANSQARFIRSDNMSVLFDSLLNDLLSLTESQVGFIGEAQIDEYGSPCLRTVAMTNIAWDQESRHMFEQHISGGLVFRNLNTLFGAVLTSKAAVLANDPQNDPRRGGLPPGHPPMDCFLGIPLMRGDEIIGIVGIANRQGGYQESLITHLDPVLQAITQIIYAYRMEAHRRLSEQETTRTRAQLETFVAYTPAAVVMVDTDLRLLAYSERWRKDFSLPHGDLHHSPLYEVLPDTPARWRDCHERALQGEAEMEEADPYIGSDGRVRWFHWDVRPWYESAEVIGGLVLFYDDVTETKRAIDTAHARERLLSKLTERVPGVLFQLRFVRSTKKLTLLYASDGSKALYGLTPEELADDPEFIFRISHPDDKALIHNAIKQAHNSGGILSIEHRILVPNKGECWVRVEASLERLADASIIWHGYVQDISQRREYESRLALSGL